ncbi:MAG: endonuclease/exonuclease/phosphatase family protein [Candidatus Saccharimonadales bacterium]|nr:endonuclease/exonuclease/phosphatase family protein [Candidatus Saccharimonadales bacterium]
MEVTTLFWNTWLDNHIDTDERRRSVERRLEELIEELQPDLIGLNEVVTRSKQTPKIISILEQSGYQIKFHPNMPLIDEGSMGNVLASRHPLKNYRLVDTGYNVLADAKAGVKGQRVQHLFADISPDKGRTFTFGVVHLLPYYLYVIAEHLRQQQPMADAMNDPKIVHPAIIGGDFNEFKSAPIPSVHWKVRKKYRRVTGNYLNPTWTAYAIPWHPIRANYDHIYWSKEAGLTLLHSQVIKNHPSDHAPITATFEIPA